MTIESELHGISGMRQIVHNWLFWRPTIRHTPQSLVGILTGEVNELREAQLQNRPQAEITAEVGDVLFSTLALDSGSEDFTTYYSTISGYCKAAGLSIRQLFDDTNFKNEINYPIYFFQRTSPFVNPRDAISCLRVFRAVDSDPILLAQHWADVGAQLDNLPFMDAYDVTRIFRNYVKYSLIDIKEKISDHAIAVKINELLTAGRWNSVPLELSHSQTENSLILF